jgi:plastocyanin
VERRAFIGVVALLLCGATTAAQSKPKPRPRTHTVTMADMKFVPQTLSVMAGDSVVWLNKDLVPHTATSTDGVFDSKTIEAGASWRHTVKKTGAFVYTCAFHPTMTGVVRVR